MATKRTRPYRRPMLQHGGQASRLINLEQTVLPEPRSAGDEKRAFWDAHNAITGWAHGEPEGSYGRSLYDLWIDHTSKILMYLSQDSVTMRVDSFTGNISIDGTPLQVQHYEDLLAHLATIRDEMAEAYADAGTHRRRKGRAS